MFKSIKVKLLVFVLILSLVPLLITNAYQLTSYTKDQNREITAHLRDIAEGNAELINQWIDQKLILVDTIYKSHPDIGSLDRNTAIETLNTIKLQYPDIETVVLADSGGKSISSEMQDINISDREYFKKAQKQQEVIISDIITSKSTGNQVISFVKPLNNDKGEFKGIFMIVGNAETLLKAVSEIKIGQTGYGYLINKETTVFLTHPTKEYIGKKHEEVNPDNIKLFKETIFTNHEGNIDYLAADNTERLGYYHLIPAANWQLVVTGKASEILQGVNTTTKVIIALIGVTSAIVAVLAVVLGSTFVKPIKKVTDLLIKTENLDLAEDDSFNDVYKHKDEIGIMARALGVTRKTMRELIEKIQQTSFTIEESTRGLSSTLGETTGSIEAVTKAMDEMAHGSGELARNTQVGAEKLEALSSKIEDINNASSEMKGFIDESKIAKDRGIEVVDKLQGVVVENEAVAARVGEKVFILDEKSEKISLITETIKSITSQINMLSLNAAIESARAGEAGRGFSVVANEIKKLAADTATSTVEIDNIIKEFKKIIEDTKTEMITAKKVIGNTSAMSKITGEAFRCIDRSVENIIAKIDALTMDIVSMSKDKDNVIRTIDGISAVSEQSAATTEEISAAVEQQSANMVAISETAQQLYNIATELKELIIKFKV